MESIKRMCILGVIAFLLCAEETAFAQSPCAILIVGQSLGSGIYRQRSGIAQIIDTANFKMKSNCSNISFINGATCGSAAECVITQQSENPLLPQNCWINHNPDYLDGARHGNALLTAKRQIDMAMNYSDPTNRKRIIAVIWSQGEQDSLYLTKTFSHYGLITEPADLCAQNVYCKAAYQKNVEEIFEVLRSKIVDYTKTNFGSVITGEEIPIFIPVIGRRVLRANTSAPSIAKLDKGIQAIRETQYEIVNSGDNVFIGALGYDQPLQAIEGNKSDQVHPTETGYFEIAKRLGFAIRSYFNHISHIPGIPTCTPIYIGPKVVEASWESADVIIATVAHSIRTSMPNAPKCTSPSYCGFWVIDGTIPLEIEVKKDGIPSTIGGLKYTRYRIRLLTQPRSSDIVLTFAFGAMNEINVPRIVNGVLESNTAKNLLTQRCLSTIPLSECLSKPETLNLPIQPAFFSYQHGTFSNVLELDLPPCPR